MNPDDVVLVALLNRPTDLELAEKEHWYRIPAKHAPTHFSGAQYVGFYLGREFRERKWRIDSYAAVRGHELVRRRDLFPNELGHPRSEEPYYKLQLGTLERRDPPIISKRGRRILFLWTNWEKFSTAREMNDLFNRGREHDRVWEGLKLDALDVEREIIVKEGHSRYRVDFLIYGRKGQVAVTIGDHERRARQAKSFQSFVFSTDQIQNHFEGAMSQILNAANALGVKRLKDRV